MGNLPRARRKPFDNHKGFDSTINVVQKPQALFSTLQWPSVNTADLMTRALQMARMETTPADSQIYVPGDDLEHVLVGIDIGEAELLLARDLGVDGVIAHHPAGGAARVRFFEVLARHVAMMEAHGVPAAEAQDAVTALALTAELTAHASNYDRVPAIARALGMPFLNIHLPWDELGRQRMVKVWEGVDPIANVAEAVEALQGLPEFRVAETKIAVRHGDPDAPLGRWVVAHACGTNGGYPVARAYLTHGVDTLLYIHIAPPELTRIREDPDLEGKSLVVTGHIASDSLGINPYLDALRGEGLQVTPVGGLLTP